MEKLRLWWKKRSIRDRRAIMVLAIVLPAILFWYLVTVPLQDRLKMARRVLETRRDQAKELQKQLQEYSFLKARLDGVEFKASSDVVSEVERVFDSMSASQTRPVLNRTNIVIFGKNQPGVHLRFDSVPPQDFWRALGLIASSGVYVSELEFSSDERQNSFSGILKAWLPEK
ncbi:MAG: hypothetical protein Kow0029_13520 [Candidatus Rifleibacteriota bacterium]